MNQSDLSVDEMWNRYFLCISTIKSIMKDVSDYENLHDNFFEFTNSSNKMRIYS